MSRIQKQDCQELIWDRHNALDYPDMVRVNTPRGPNSLLHALLQGFSKVYHSESKNGKFLSRDEFIQQIRRDLAQRIRRYNGEKNNNYHRLIKLLLRKHKHLSIDTLADQITDFEYKFRIDWLGFLCEALNIDIYLLDEEAWNVYIYDKHEETYYLDPGHRNVVVLLIENDGFSTIGLITDEERIESYFDPNCNFIHVIRQAMHEQRELMREHYAREPTVPPTIPRVPHHRRVRRAPSPDTDLSEE